MSRAPASRAAQIRFVKTGNHSFAWVSLAAWSVAFAGLARSLLPAGRR